MARPVANVSISHARAESMASRLPALLTVKQVAATVGTRRLPGTIVDRSSRAQIGTAQCDSATFVIRDDSERVLLWVERDYRLADLAWNVQDDAHRMIGTFVTAGRYTRRGRLVRNGWASPASWKAWIYVGNEALGYITDGKLFDGSTSAEVAQLGLLADPWWTKKARGILAALVSWSSVGAVAVDVARLDWGRV